MADMFGGQGTDGVKLCYDCIRRPKGRGAIAPKTERPPCTLRWNLDAIAARDACGGRDWEKR